MSTFESRVQQKTKKLKSLNENSKQYEQSIDYLLQTLPYIKKYEEERQKTMDETPSQSGTPSASEHVSIDSFINVSKQAGTRQVFDEYLANVERNEDAMQRLCLDADTVDSVRAHPSMNDSGLRKCSAKKDHLHNINMAKGMYDTCHECGGRQVYNEQESVMVCIECGLCVPHIETSSKNLTHAEQLEHGNRRQFTYKRCSHFCETLSSVQGRQRITIPDDVISAVFGEIKKHRLEMNDVTPKHVRNFLKRLGYPKYYEASHYILKTLRGDTDPVIPRHIEDTLIKMFVRIQKPFQNVCEKGRKNMLRYHFIIYKLLELLGDDGKPYLHLFPLLKSVTKLAQHDATWKKICEQVGWEFIPTT